MPPLACGNCLGPLRSTLRYDRVAARHVGYRPIPARKGQRRKHILLAGEVLPFRVEPSAARARAPTACGRPDAVPGMVGAIQTFSQLIHAHPNIHALVSEGVFLPDGTFLALPKLATEPFLKLWEQDVFGQLPAKGKITEDVVANMRSWRHSGFSVDQSVRLKAGDQEGVQRLIQYSLRCPFSQARMIQVTEAGKVIYKTEHLPAPTCLRADTHRQTLRQAGNAVGRFPEPGDGELLAGPARNFQVFDPLDFLAEVTQHIPDPGSHLLRYDGWYSNKTRSQRAQRQPTAAAGTGIPARSPTAREARKGWACLRADTHRQAARIKQVHAADPICCLKCGTTMRIVAFIACLPKPRRRQERHQTEAIEKILRHCGLWDEPSARAPPSAKVPVTG